jgi:hypothetical protein
MWGSSYFGSSYFDQDYFGSYAAPTVDADSLLSALGTFWTDNDLGTTIAPLYAYGAPASATLPYVVADGFLEEIPGYDEDNTPVEVYFTAYANSDFVARTIGRSLGEWLESARMIDPDDDPVVNPNRDAALEWTTGYELCCEPNGTVIDAMPKPGVGGRQFRVRAHYTFWISGRP